MLFESYRGTNKIINSIWYNEEFVSTVHFSDILMVLKNSRSKSCENLHHRFFSFSRNDISRYITLAALNCKLSENVLYMFCLILPRMYQIVN